MITHENKVKAIDLVKKHENDTGSVEAQVSILTNRIKEITAHLKSNKHDVMAHRGLLQLVGKRKRLLGYLEKSDFDSYKSVVSTLGLRK